MGNCCQRRAVIVYTAAAEEDDWQVISEVLRPTVAASSQDTSPNPVLRPTVTASTSVRPGSRLKRAAQKVIRLLFLRRLWAKLGVYLNKNISWRNRRRHLLSSAWQLIGNYLKVYTKAFNHLERKQGKLVYK